MSTDNYADLHTGHRTSTVYYWVDPDTGAALSHTGVNDGGMVPFFADNGRAEQYLERQIDLNGAESYDQYSLYEAKTRKVADAVDVLTEQSGIEEFLEPNE